MSSSPRRPITHFRDPDARGVFVVVVGSCESTRPSYAAKVRLVSEWQRGLDMFNELVLEHALASMLTEYAVNTELVPATIYYPLIWTLPPLAHRAPTKLLRLYEELDVTDDAIAELDMFAVLGDVSTRLRKTFCMHRKRTESDIAWLEYPLNLECVMRGPLNWLVALRLIMNSHTFGESELCEYLFRRAGLGKSDREGWLWPHDFSAAVDLLLDHSDSLRDSSDAYYDTTQLLHEMVCRVSLM